MGQQPNLELGLAELPRAELSPAPPRRWRPSRPGEITSPRQVPSGVAFGHPGPDTGWALRIIGLAEVPARSPELEAVLGALMAARASVFGRAPVEEDLVVGLVLVGLDPLLAESAKVDAVERRTRWLRAAGAEKPPGRTALAEVDPGLLALAPDELRLRLAR